jgi:uncharacterized Zn finger protein (UPF0148 family)
LIIDYSAHRTWATCPANWYELYINKRRKAWPKAQRDDALALGSLVHDGLQQWQEHQQVAPSEKVIEEIGPTQDCLTLAIELVSGYAQHYPEEVWPLVKCEEPVRFPLSQGSQDISACPECGWIEYQYLEQCPNCETRLTYSRGLERLGGLAKIDAYFYVPEPTTIESGQEGLTFTLSPGWWIHEYKTKSPYVGLGPFMQGWEMGMQANYQLIALKEFLSLNGGEYGVQGILINVLEKPKRYIPKRKCKQCNESYEFSMWIPIGDGQWCCPVCGSRQVLQKLKENPSTVPPAYYRIVVTRTPEQLAHAREEMITVGQRMLAMQAGGLRSEPWNRDNCVDQRWGRECQFFTPHLHGQSTVNDPGFIQVEDYRKIGEEI